MANGWIHIRIREDIRVDRVEREMQRKLQEAMNNAAETVANDIRSNWTKPGPSSPGQAPGVLTGNLDSSVRTTSDGRDAQGRFAPKNMPHRFVRINTAEGDNPLGRGDYATVLEDKLNRPYVQPAIDRVSRIFPYIIKRTI